MFCSNCGNIIDDNNKFCPYCGNPVTADNVNNTAPFTNTPMPVQQVQHPMKWYKFVIYFQLFAGALINIGSLGLVIRDKSDYEEQKKEVLEAADFGSSYYDEMLDMFGKLDTYLNICIVIAVCSALAAILAIVARQKLAHYKKEGPKLLLIYYGVNLGINIATVINCYMFIPKEVVEAYDFSQVYGYIIAVISLIVCNRIYFKKREYMFVN